jgi:hypothetical protein
MATKLARAPPHAGFERAGLVAGAVRAVEVLDVHALRGMPAHGQFRDLPRLVGRVVEHLDLEPLARVVDRQTASISRSTTYISL